MDAVLVGLL